MIIGIGCDLVDIRRIENMLIKYDKSFINRIFASQESFYIPNNQAKACFFAKRFAAKEALVKALGIGFRHGITWRDICVLNNNLGKPYIKLGGEATKQLEKLSKQYANRKEVKIHVSLSDEPPYAQAMVILEI